MAFTAAHTALFDQGSPMARTFAAIGDYFIRYAEKHSRQAEIAALEAKSDAELDAMGLTRDGIIRHVFSNSFYL